MLIVGPRQVGKSTLGQQVARSTELGAEGAGTFQTSPSRQHLPENYLTLDDPTILSAVLADPSGFLTSQDPARVTVIDEVQRAPGLLLAIKADVDANRQPGRFLLTGSANVLQLPRLSESLAGRMEPLQLWSLAQTEIARTDARFLDHVFGPSLPLWSPEDSRGAILSRAYRGGFPEVLARETAVRRRAWFASYLTTVIQREVRDISNISDPVGLHSMLELIAARSSGPLNMQSIATPLKIAHKTATRYIDLLEAVFLIVRIPAWSNSVDVRTAKAPKALVTDSGLLAHLLRIDEASNVVSDVDLGILVETFVGTELLKYCSWADPGYALSYWRNATGAEVDYVLQDPAGRVVAIEVKAATSVTADDFKHLRVFAERERNVQRAVVLYAGMRTLPFGEQFYAVPISALWREPG